MSLSPFSRQYLKQLLIAYVIVLAVNLMANGRAYLAGTGNWKTGIGFSLGIATLGWFSFTWLLNTLLQKFFDWRNHATRSFILFLLCAAIYGALLMLLYGQLVSWLFNVRINPKYLTSDITMSVLITVIMTLIVCVNYFIAQWKKGIAETASLQQAVLASRYETLKNQVNPHFLFNAFNTLTSLIQEDSNKAVEFVHQLARVFRYSLLYADKNTVDLESELQVTLSFLQVCEQRFINKLFYTVELPDHNRKAQIVTHSLLMLAENAIKHNEISTARPLHIRIYAEDQYLCVANTLQVKRAIDSSNGIGLANMQQRYRHITGQPVLVQETPQQFIVKIPLLIYETTDSGR
ncbi:sensor histidine kinase YesM [Filimonas zeae]|uniref:Signal transduction histidine kinase internal region domain-containing protein n=1 Tax=Filimonas zeae TaxID=1737353 RepID=A0A917IMB3_9BACT|nr:histidine kinase [Filimonas zeae]MDR6337318.1 sensor histidine kinase YesM [Filimonas zeae]GGH58022.1 hypothetical protein GCM10011379_03340 [Filimonas zeae]